MTTLVACGLNDHYQLSLAADSRSVDGYNILKVPQKMKIQRKLTSIAAGEFHTVFTFAPGIGFALGSDKNFRIGTTNRVEYDKAIKLEWNNIKMACCGESYTAYLTKEGKIILCTSNSEPREPFIIELEVPVIYIAGNNRAICALDAEGEFYLFDEDPTVFPRKYKLKDPVFDLARGNRMTIAVTTSGVAYGNGKLNDNNRKFAVIPSLEGIKVRRCFAKFDHVGVITEDGRVFMWGDGLYGQLGNGTKDNNVDFDEIIIEPGSRVVSMGVGISHSVFVTDTGNVYGCGRNKNAELMLGHDYKRILTPQKWCVRDAKAVQVWCGAYDTFVMCNGEPVPHLGAQHFNVD